MNTYKTKGVCSKQINFEVKEDIVTKVVFERGCDRNLQGISKLVEGMKVDDIVEKLKNIKCGFKETSCPAQLAIALNEYKKTSINVAK